MILAILLCIVRSHAAVVDDPESLAGSFNTYMKIREKLPLMVRNQLWITDDAEEAILGRCAQNANVPQSLFTAYTSARAAEREIIKTEAREGGTEKAMEIMDVYRAVRKETPWNFMKLRQKFKACFERPTSGLKEYLALRKQETTKDAEISKLQTEMVTAPQHQGAGGEQDQGRGGAPQQEEEDDEEDEEEEGEGGASKEEGEETREEMERSARSKDTETGETEKGAGRGSVFEDVHGTVDGTNEDGEIYESSDNFTSADVTNTESTTNTSGNIYIHTNNQYY